MNLRSKFRDRYANENRRLSFYSMKLTVFTCPILSNYHRYCRRIIVLEQENSACELHAHLEQKNNSAHKTISFGLYTSFFELEAIFCIFSMWFSLVGLRLVIHQIMWITSLVNDLNIVPTCVFFINTLLLKNFLRNDYTSTSSESWALVFPNTLMVHLSVSNSTRVTKTTNIGLKTRSPIHGTS